MAEQFCRGSAECDCEGYTAPPNLLPGEPAKCVECLHGPSKHPKLALTAPPTVVSPQVSVVPASKDSVLAMFQRTATADPTPLSISSISEKSGVLKSSTGATGTSYESARSESLSGFRPKCSSNSVVAVSAPKQKSQRSGQSTKTTVCTFGWICVLPWGLDGKGQLIRSTKPPTPAEFGNLQAHGCAKVGVTIDTAWTHEQCTEFLTDLFPRPFSYAIDIYNKSGSSSSKPLWVIVARGGRGSIQAVDNTKATGGDLFFFRHGAYKTQSDKQSIIISLRRPIPQDVYDSWMPPVECSSDIDMFDLLGNAPESSDESEHEATPVPSSNETMSALNHIKAQLELPVISSLPDGRNQPPSHRMSTRSQSKCTSTMDNNNGPPKKKQKTVASTESHEVSSISHNGSKRTKKASRKSTQQSTVQWKNDISLNTAAAQNLGEKSEDEQVSGVCTVATVAARLVSSSPLPIPSNTLCPCKSMMVSPVIDVIKHDPNSYYSWKYEEITDPARLISPWSDGYKIWEVNIWG